jgi:capsule biosynthesis phosphatase
MKNLVLDIDDTITHSNTQVPYSEIEPRIEVIKKIREYKKSGFKITFYTSRNMRTYEGSIGKINAFTLPVILTWLDKNDVPYDEVIVGKPWCGHDGFYVDDKAIRPSEFINLSYDEVLKLIND